MSSLAKFMRIKVKKKLKNAQLRRVIFCMTLDNLHHVHHKHESHRLFIFDRNAMAFTLAKYLHCVRTACALRGHCVRTACILRTQRPGYLPKNTYHLTNCTAKQQSPHENDETAFNLVLHCPYEQTTQPCKVRLLMASEMWWG